MKKRIIAAVLLAIALLTLFSGCQTNDPGKSNEEESFAFSWNGKDIRPGDIGTDMKAIAGEWKNYFESPSCAFEGIDKTYTFASFAISTTPSEDGKDDVVQSIRLLNDGVATKENVYVGQDAAKAKEVYGESIGVSDSYLRYVKGDTEIQVIIENGKIASIEYVAAE